MSKEKNIAVCHENRTIVKEGGYEAYGHHINLPSGLRAQQSVVVLHPRFVAASGDTEYDYCSNGVISVVNADSFSQPSQLVLNFANAYNPGGGYLHGARAQEESLCRQSTLYASISSEKAQEMYKANRAESSFLGTDYMLLSQSVDVFRDAELRLLERPWTTAVITAAAPDLKDPRAIGTSKEELEAHMLNRIRNVLNCAAAFNYKYITLGAWGCGAFGHDAAVISECFRTVLIEEGLRFLFDSITFAVLDSSESRYNYNSFAETFIDCV